MINTKECDIGQIIHGSCRLLQKIHKMIFKNCNLNHFFAKEGSEMWMDSQMWRNISVTERHLDKCVNIEDYKPRWRLCCVHWCMQERAWWGSHTKRSCGMLWVQKTKREWEELYYTWIGISDHYSCIKNVEKLPHGEEIWDKDKPLWSKTFVWTTHI